MDYMQEYERWRVCAPEFKDELDTLAGDQDALLDAFRCELAFGTAGLRGVIGAGPNRMNVYTVGKATQGLADYLNAHYDNPSVCISRDSRNMGEVFVETVAGVLAANGVHAYVYTRPVPTPACSFGVRYLGCSAGVNVTASHNPACYNGYKVYGDDGCQIASAAADAIQASIDKTDFFADVKRLSLQEAVANGLVTWVTQETYDAFLDEVQQQSLPAAPDTPLTVVYTPLNGTGLECVTRILSRNGIDDVVVVPQQAAFDGDFPTCPYPNPEIREALECGLALCDSVDPDLLLATDPDADRVGIAVSHGGEHVLLSGNEVGALLCDYIAQTRRQRGEDLSRLVAVTTIVSTSLVDALAQDYGFQLRRTLTGFKHIGTQIALLEQVGNADRFMIGFEESYGYLVGTHVRDKDAIVASMLICQMAQYHKSCGRDLVDAINDLYARYGYHKNVTVSLSYPGAKGADRMKELMQSLHSNPPAKVGGFDVREVADYANSAAMPVCGPAGDDEPQKLPCADVIELKLDGAAKLIVRPSGTEPKIKAYVFACGDTAQAAQEQADVLVEAAKELLS